MSCSPGPREARKADRRRAILSAAERAFLHHGYAATSMSTIAAEVGGSKTTLWSYFPSKEALFAAVLDAKIATFEGELDQALLSTEGPRAVLTRFGCVLLNKIMSPGSIALHRLIVAEAPRFPSLGEAFATRGPDRVRARLRGWMTEAMAAGRLRDGDPDVAARQFVALCQAGCYLDRLWRPTQETIDRIDMDVATAVDGFMNAWSPAAA